MKLNKKLFTLTATTIAVLIAMPSQAQSNGDIARNIEQARRSMPQPKEPVRTPQIALDGETFADISKLARVNVKSTILKAEIENYWADKIGKSVSPAEISKFKAFAWDLFQSKGYLAFVTLEAVDGMVGSTLEINVTTPAIGRVTLVAHDEIYAREVAKRFTTAFPQGAPVDVAAFESNLAAISYALPVLLDIKLQQTETGEVDVVISSRLAPSNVGEFIGGVVQGNNYGISQFGRSQALTNMRFVGLTPASEINLTGQLSKGVKYARAEYEAPVDFSGVHARAFATEIKSESNTANNDSVEIGAGLIKLIRFDRHGRLFASADVVHRTSVSNVLGVENSNRVADQLRFKLRTESQNDWVDSFRNEFTLTAGYLDLSKNQADKSTDADQYQTAGNYKVLDSRGSITHALKSLADSTASVRWVGQISSRNLDGFDKMAIGGMSGVRAFSSLDGVGDQGLAIQLDLTKPILASHYAGLLYDVGIVKAHRFNKVLTIADNATYTLQGAGFQLGGQINQFNWNTSLTKSFGNTPHYWLSNQTEIGSWRLNFAATLAF